MFPNEAKIIKPEQPAFDPRVDLIDRLFQKLNQSPLPKRTEILGDLVSRVRDLDLMDLAETYEF